MCASKRFAPADVKYTDAIIKSIANYHKENPCNVFFNADALHWSPASKSSYVNAIARALA
jgi:hypothetical protein